MGGLSPDWWCASVLDVSPAWVVEAGFKAVLLDLDNTLQARDRDSVGADEHAWVESLKREGLSCCLVSNTAKPRVRDAAASLELPLVENAYKPLAGGYRRALELVGEEPSRAIMVGDQTYTDILGAHRAGMRAVLVDPLCDVDLAHTRLLRKLDRRAVRGMEREKLEAGQGR